MLVVSGDSEERWERGVKFEPWAQQPGKTPQGWYSATSAASLQTPRLDPDSKTLVLTDLVAFQEGLYIFPVLQMPGVRFLAFPHLVGWRSFDIVEQRAHCSAHFSAHCSATPTTSKWRRIARNP